MTHNAALFIDGFVILAYFVVIVGIGLYAGRRTDTLQECALGGHKIPWWAVLASLIAAETSAATFLGTPAEGYKTLGFAYAQLLATTENFKTNTLEVPTSAPPNTADMPGWNRPTRRSIGLPSEQSYGGCGGCSGSFEGEVWWSRLSGGLELLDSLETPGEDREALDQEATEEPVTEQQATTTQQVGP